MTGNIKGRSDSMRDADGVTRRTMLGGTAVALGLGAAALTSTRAMAKTSQQDAKYQDQPKGQAKCSGCSQFEPPAACKIVDGKIDPNGWCQFYTPKQG